MGHTILLPLLERAADPIEELPAFMSQCLLLRSHRLTTKMVLHDAFWTDYSLFKGTVNYFGCYRLQTTHFLAMGA